MQKMTLQLMGKPKIEMDGKVVELSLKKSEALLYYLAYEKRVTREELTGMIWCDVEQHTAKKNLRNSLYRIKKDLDVEVFAHPNKNTIEFSKTLDLKSDLDHDDMTFLASYQGAFLETFIIKNSDRFEQWRQSVESDLNRRFRHLASMHFDKCLESDKWELAFSMAATLKKMDPFDELATRLLMRAYKHKNMYKQLVEAYSELKNLLEEEMGIKPDSETRALYYRLIQSRAKDETRVDELFGRKLEVQKIEQAMQAFSKKQSRQALVVEGEAGVGKTKLLKATLASVETMAHVVWSSCYVVEESFAYKAWNAPLGELLHKMREKGFDCPEGVEQVLSKVFPSIMPVGAAPYLENMETIRTDYLERLICKLLSDLSKSEPIVFVFDDLQWMDEWSLKLLQSVMLHVEGVTFVATARKIQTEKLERVLTHLERYNLVERLVLERFSEKETIAFLDTIVEDDMSIEEKKKVFKASEGNAFFIVEYAGLYHRNDHQALYRLKNLMDARLMEVSKEAGKVLSMLSMFFDEADHLMVQKLYSKPIDRLLEVLDELQSKDFIYEIESEDAVKWRFTHHKLREHVYEKTPLITRRVLHNKIGELLENELTGEPKDVLIFQKLMYHYQGAKNKGKQLAYTIAYLKTYFDFSHELYPEGQMTMEIHMDFSPEYYFEQVEKLFENTELDDVNAVKLKFMHMKARYHIRNGEYEEGLALLEDLMALAEKMSDGDMCFKAHVQYVYYLIQTEQVKDMKWRLSEMAQFAKRPKRKYMLERLMGIERLMSEDYPAARAHFMSSINGFESLTEKHYYALNIAAAYNYISESYFKEGVYDLALEFANKAIVYCKTHNIMRGRSIFNTNAGMIAYELGDKALSKAYFVEALRCFDVIDSFWRKSEAEGYLGMIYMEEGEIDKGWRLMQSAKARAVKMNTPKTILLLESLETRAKNVYDVNSFI